MSIPSQSIREIIAANPSAARVLERFEIDPRAEADNTLDRACAALQLSVEQVIEKLENAETAENGGVLIDPSSLSATRLIQHIVRVHHRTIRQDLPRLAALAREIGQRDTERAAYFDELARLIDDLRSALLAHIEKEEMVLFPFIAQMEEQSVVAYPPAHACFRTVTHPVFMLAQEHEAALRIEMKLQRAANGFTVPEEAAGCEAALLAGLRRFESGLSQHVHLENDVLFPRAIEMESDIQAHRACAQVLPIRP